MKPRNVWAILRKELRHILRDRSTLLLATLAPAFLLVIFTYSLSVDVKNVSVAVLDQDNTALTRRYLSLLTSTADLVVDHFAAGYGDVERWINRGRVRAAVVIPSGFTADARSGRPTAIQVIVDGTDPTTAGHAIRHIVSRTENFATNILNTSLTRQGVPVGDAPSIELRAHTWYNPQLKFVIGIAPALIAVVLSMPAVSVSLSLTREKERGTMEFLAASPLGRLDIIIGKILPYLFLGLLSVVLCVLLIMFWFQVPFQGNPFLYLVLAADYLFAMFAIAMLISVVVNTQQVAIVVSIIFFMFSSIFTSGIFYPISAMDRLMKLEAMSVPATHFVSINRGVFVRGAGLDGVWVQTLSLLGMGVFYVVLTFLLLRKKVS